MRFVQIAMRAFSVFLLGALSWCLASAQSSEQLAESRAGIDVGFDPTPVEIPQIHKTAPHPVTCMDLLRLRDVIGLQISPDAKYVAFVLQQATYESNSYRTGLFVMTTAKNGQPVTLGTAGPPHWDDINESLPENPQWSPDDKFIYRTMQSSGLSQVWRWKREGGAPEQVTHAQQNVKSFYLSPDGTKMLIMVGTPSMFSRKQLGENGILYDGSFEATGQSIIDRIVSTPGGEDQPWIVELTNNNVHKATEAEVKALNLGAGANAGMNDDPLGTTMRQIFTQKEIDELRITNFSISPDHKMVAYSYLVDDPAESKWGEYPLAVRPLAGGPSITLATWYEYTELFWWGADSKEIYFTSHSNDPGDPRKEKLMAVSAHGGKTRLVFDSPFFQRMYSVDRFSRFAAFLREDNTTADELALADLSSGEMRALMLLNPEVQNLQITPAQRIDVSDKQGEHFWGHYVLPPGYHQGKRYPLVITTYADYGGFLRGAVGDEYPIHVFAANGFVVLNFNGLTRTASTTPDDFDSTLRIWQGPIEAMEAGVDKLSEMGIIDPSRVAITGLSYGAAQVDYGIAHSNLFRTAINSGGGGWDPIVYYLVDDAWRNSTLAQAQKLGLPEGDMLMRYKKISLALNASRVHTPLLINASDAEYIYNMQHLVTLRALKKPVEMFIYPDERHEKNQPKHRYSIYQRNVDWLNFWLQDYEDPDPAKAEQYKRWHELRKLDEKDRESAAQSTELKHNQ